MTIREGIRSLKQISVREIRKLCLNPLYFFCMIVAPIGSLFFLMTLMQDGLPTNLPVAVVDLDNTPTSRQLIRQLDAFEQTSVAMQCASFEEARRRCRKEIFTESIISREVFSVKPHQANDRNCRFIRTDRFWSQDR